MCTFSISSNCLIMFMVFRDKQMFSRWKSTSVTVIVAVSTAAEILSSNLDQGFQAACCSTIRYYRTQSLTKVLFSKQSQTFNTLKVTTMFVSSSLGTDQEDYCGPSLQLLQISFEQTNFALHTCSCHLGYIRPSWLFLLKRSILFFHQNLFQSACKDNCSSNSTFLTTFAK